MVHTPEMIRQFEKIETKLEYQELSDFQPIGKSFQIVLTAL